MHQTVIKTVAAVVILIGVWKSATADAKTEPYPANLEQKLGAGLVNTATGWVELAKTPIAMSKKEGIGWGLTLGPVMGVVNTIGRTACGVFDVVTFILPTKPLIEPPMIWQDFETPTTYKGHFEIYDH